MFVAARLLVFSLVSVHGSPEIQDSDDPSIPVLIDRLASPSIEERNSAEKELSAKGNSILASLERLISSSLDPETKARIETVVRKIRVREAETLVERGALDDALLKLAEADRAKDTANYVSTRLAAVGRDMQSWYPPSDRLINIIPDYDRQAKRVWETHGLLGLGFLVQELGSQRYEVIPTGRLLEAMGKPAVLPLVRALSSNNRLLQTNACYILNEIMANLKRSGITTEWLIHNGPEWIEGAARLALDQEAGKSVREIAKSMSEELTKARRTFLVRCLLSKAPQERLAAEQQVRAEGKDIASELRRSIAALPDGDDKSRLEHLLKELVNAKKPEELAPPVPEKPHK